jgi:KipI family sensor histidine kinase inhibitor
MIVEIAPYGDSAVLATSRGGTAEQRWRAVHRLADAVQAAMPPGVEGVVATYDSLLVEFDCDLTTYAAVSAALRAATPGPASATASRTFRVPVVYGGEHGPDLAEVAAELDLPAAEVVRRHAAARWVVRFLGAPVGAPMLDGSPFAAPVRRCPRPRMEVPAGSVALAGLQAVVYPVRSPGGWRLIGRTPLRLADPARSPVVAYRPGDVIRFEPVDTWGDDPGRYLDG